MFEIDEKLPAPRALAYLGSSLLLMAGLFWILLIAPLAVAALIFPIMGAGLLFIKGFLPLAVQGFDLFAKGVGRALGVVFDL